MSAWICILIKISAVDRKRGLKYCEIAEKYVNYAELYGVKPDETNFYGAIKRWKESGMKVKHLDNFVKELYEKG